MLNAPDNVIHVDFSRKRKVSNDDTALASPVNPKRKMFEEMLESGIVSVSFDPRESGVQIPERFTQNASLILNFSYGFQIHDFRFNDQMVSATLMFPEGQYFCVVPWTAVFALHSEELQKSIYWEPQD